MKKVFLSILGVFFISFAIFSCTKENSKESSTTNSLKRIGIWTGKSIESHWGFDNSSSRNMYRECPRIQPFTDYCYEYVDPGSGEDFWGIINPNDKGFKFEISFVDDSKLRIKPIKFSDNISEQEFFNRGVLPVAADYLLDFPFFGQNSNKKVYLLKGDYPIVTTSLNEGKCYIDIPFRIEE